MYNVTTFSNLVKANYDRLMSSLV